MIELWTEKYRPGNINDYVFRDDIQRKQVQSWIDAGSIPHLLFSGAPGIGKTTLAKVLVHELDVYDADVMEINASRENSVDNVRERITGFVSTMPFGNFKIVILDEADYISPYGQAALRGVMETYASTARFILTCNYPNKIIPALHSRCQGFHIEKIDKTKFIERVISILLNEKIEIKADVLDIYIDATYPDLRKCLNLLQMNSMDGVLMSPKDDEGAVLDYRLSAVELFKQKKINEAREIICKQSRPEEAEDTFRWMYDNIDIWGDTQEKKDQAILFIAEGLKSVPLVADQEINLSATLVKLSNLLHEDK